MKFSEIAFVCYPVKDLKKSREFYEGVLGLKATQVWADEKSGFIEYDIGSGTFAIGAGSDQFKPSKDGVSAALEVEDFDAAMKELKAANVPFRMEPMEASTCHMALIEDPDGNALMIHKRKK